MVSKPTLAVAHTGQCAGIWCKARVGPDGTHCMTYDASTVGTGVRQEGVVLDTRVGELDRRGRRVL